MKANVNRSDMPKLGSLAPAIELLSLQDKRFSLWGLKGKKNVVIVFYDTEADCDIELLAELARHNEEIADNNAQVLAIASAPVDDVAACLIGMELPFPVLVDFDGWTVAAYGVTEATIFVTDRFGAIRLIEEPGDDTLGKVLNTLDLIEIECPECGVSTWPEPE